MSDSRPFLEGALNGAVIESASFRDPIPDDLDGDHGELVLDLTDGRTVTVRPMGGYDVSDLLLDVDGVEYRQEAG